MASVFWLYTCCLIILAELIDKGDGRWRERDREKLKKDIESFRSMADKIEYEIEEFYDEYLDERQDKDDIKINHYKDIGTKLTPDATQSGVNKDALSELINKTSNFVSNFNPKHVSIVSEHKSNTVRENNNVTRNRYFNTDGNARWPKFEDIMLAIGKKYDWKNDRWIKVKRKFKDVVTNKLNISNNRDYHIKHNFLYRMIKLNRGKSRRNVVVAVSAVR